jgi:hypothetical protein
MIHEQVKMISDKWGSKRNFVNYLMIQCELFDDLHKLFGYAQCNTIEYLLDAYPLR